MRRWKEKDPHPSGNPQTRAEIVVNPSDWLTGHGEDFVIYQDSPQTEKRMFMFGTRRNLELLERCRIWSIDGTFQVKYDFILILILSLLHIYITTVNYGL